MSERITKRLDDDSIILFPTRTLPMKMSRNEADLALQTSGNMWELACKLCDYEDLEEKLQNKGISCNINDIASHIVTSVDDLSETMLEDAYRKKEIEYRTQDALRQIEDIIDDDEPVTKAMLMAAADVLAERFLDNYDCNIAENQLWDITINNYISDEL